MKPPEFLELDTVLFLHGQALRNYGGRHGLRDETLLQSALFRPAARLHLAAPPPDLFELASCYAFGLATNHPFIDGNKRTAWSSAMLFLKLNTDTQAAAPRRKKSADVIVHMLALVEHRLTEAAFAAWLRTPQN